MKFSWTRRLFLIGTFLACISADQQPTNLPPLISERPTNSTTVEGTTFTFTCRAVGEPKPRMKWSKGGVAIDSSDVMKNGNLQIRATNFADAGLYTCRAESILGYTEKSAWLVVKEQTKITQSPVDVTVPVGKSAVFHCSVSSDPSLPVTITWLHNGETIDFSPDSRFAQSANNSLTITHAQLPDNGTYICLAKTDVDEATAEGHLVVAEHIKISLEPKDLLAPLGATARFHCVATSKFPLPLSVTWRHNGETIDISPGSRFSQALDNSLNITDVRYLDVGTYTCVARTAVDEVSADVQLFVSDVPNAPRIRSVTCSTRQATIKWEPTGDNHSPIQMYTLMYHSSSSPNVWRLIAGNIPPTEKKAVFIMKEIWANYTFTVSASNAIGQSRASDTSVPCETESDVPHNNPLGVQGKGRGNSSLVISWTAMPREQHNGPGFKYRLYWRQDTPDVKWKATNISDWQKTEYVVANQPKNRKYRIQVVAVNDRGVAKVSPREVIGYTGAGVPTQSPANFIALEVVNGTHALVRWDPVAPETVQGNLLGYMIQVWTERVLPGALTDILVNDGSTSRLLTNLLPYSKNYARVMVYNEEHDGPPSKTLVINTREGVPGLVHNFEAHAMGSSALYITWEPPQEANGVLTGYKISCVSSRDFNSSSDVRILDPKHAYVKITGLSPETEYRLGIAASTRIGEGNYSFIYTSTKANNTAPPGTPRFEWSKEPTFNGAARIRVVWKPALDGNLGSNFFVKYREKGERTGKVHKTPPQLSDVTTVVGGLTPSKVYDFKVVAVDGEHQTESDSQEVDTVPVVISPQFVSRFPSQKLKHGVKKLSLKCVARGDLPMHIFWSLEGYPVPENDRYATDEYLTVDYTMVSHLNISNLTGRDGGEYSCTARNNASQVTHKGRVDVSGQPFIRVMPSVRALAGSVVIVKCPVTGYPILSIVWKKDGKQLVNNDRLELYLDGTLMIYNAQHETDSGTYTCEAHTVQELTATRDVVIEVLETALRGTLPQDSVTKNVLK